MAEYTIILCDMCLPDPADPHGPGTIWATFEQAKTMGWEEREYGHICPECVEKEASEADGEGDVRGPLYQNQLDFVVGDVPKLEDN